MTRLLNQLRAKSLAALMLAAATLPFGCATAPTYPPPAADKAQVVVKVTATPKAGVQAPRTEGQYDKESVEKGRRFTRVNYSKMDCIAVVLIGESRWMGPEDGNEVEIASHGFTRDLSIGFMKQTVNGHGIPAACSFSFRNNRSTSLTLFGSTPSNETNGTFEIRVPANGVATCALVSAGLYDVYCDEDENLYCQILATSSTYAQLCESGGEAFFEGLAPGAYEVEVYAPRLPVWRMKVNAVAGKRETLYAEVTVNKLPKAK